MTDLQRIKEIFTIQSVSHNEIDMYNYIVKVLATLNVITELDEYGNILVTKGTVEDGGSFPCLAAHMDTVHDIKDDYKVVEFTKQGKLALKAMSTNKQNQEVNAGGCGDDQGGVWLALDLLGKIDNLKVVFFSNEEVGTIGSGNINLDFFSDCGYIIEGDRRNGGDIIDDGMCSPDFLSQLEEIGKPFGYKKEVGVFTDVTTLSERGVGIACVNLSIGYYEAHTKNEYTVVQELINARDYVEALVLELGNTKYPHTYSQDYGRSYYGSYYQDDFDDFYFPNSCEVHAFDAEQGLIDLSCYSCNPTITTNSGIYCSDCLTEMTERQNSHYCTVCNNHKIAY